MKLHRHRWLFARPALYGGVVDVCAVDGCPARRYRPAAGDVRCGWCRGDRHERRCCECCSVLPDRQEATR